MATALVVFKDSMIKNEDLQAEAEKQTQADLNRAEQMRNVAADFETEVSTLMNGVTEASGGLKQTAVSLSRIAEESDQNSAIVASSAEETSTNVQTVSGATGQLAASIAEISEQVTQSSDLARESVAEAKVAKRAGYRPCVGSSEHWRHRRHNQRNRGTDKLAGFECNDRIRPGGRSRQGIRGCRQRGQAGLAGQTAKATKDISNQITDIQGMTDNAVKAIGAISRRIDDIDGLTTGVASAIEEQNTATQEISRNVEELARASEDVNQHMNRVSQTTRETGNASEEVRSASDLMAEQSNTLNDRVTTFLEQVRAA